MSEIKIDPITFEILSHKLWQITDEMASVLTRTSGSVVVYEVRDFMTALYDPAGNAVMIGCGVIFHGAATVYAVKHVAETYKDNPGINEDDVFLLNDPYIAACHQPDMVLITPIHYQGELVAWAASMCHVPDSGGIDPGGFCARATEVYQEGFRSPGIKVIERGELRQDVWDTILNMVRDPGGVGLDLKAEMATSQTAKRRVLELIGQYGVEMFKAACAEMINYSEVKLRARLAELPDGKWRAIEYLDDDGVTEQARKVVLTMTKEGDSLTFDFTGTDGQSASNRNSSLAATQGGVFGSLAPMLCYDVPWSQGILNVMKVIAPEGTIINPKMPAALTEGTIGPAYLVQDAALVTISEMLNASEKWKEEATAVWTPSVAGQAFAGVNQHGTFMVTLFMDHQGGGGGARTYADGVDTGGILWQPTTTMPNVEAYEMVLPVLYLFRRQTMDSGGAGKFRGGVGGEYAFMLYHSPTGHAIMPPNGAIGTEAAIGYGISGGYPTVVKRFKMVRDSDIKAWIERGEIPQYPEELKGDLTLLSMRDVWAIGDNDVFYQNWFGGGGYGDPLDRDPEMVRKDVENMLVSMDCAERIYGVSIDHETLEVDLTRTAQRRTDMRKNRLHLAKKAKQ